MKKTKKQIAIEKRIKELKTQHGTLSKQKRVLEKRLRREDSVDRKKIDAFYRQIERLQKKIRDYEDKPLPSEKARSKIVDKLVLLEDKIRAAEALLRDITNPPPSDAKRAHEAGDDEEE